jgi:hypothetical protein
MRVLEGLLSGLRAVRGTFPDARQWRPDNLSMADAGMAAFALFFMQSESFLSHQRRLQRGRNGSNCQTTIGNSGGRSPRATRRLSMAGIGSRRRACESFSGTSSAIIRRPRTLYRKPSRISGDGQRTPTDSINLDSVDPDGVDSGGAGLCRAEASSVMADALGLLPSDQRTLLWLREAEGQSYGELVVILELEIPICTVRSRLFAAREALGLSGAFV